MGVVCILKYDDHVVPSTWVSRECGYSIAGGGCLSLNAHRSSLGAPGSHGSDSFLHPQCCCVSGPDVLAGSGRPGLSMVVSPRGCLSASLHWVLAPFCAHCDLVGHVTCSFPALCGLSLLLRLSPHTCHPRAQNTAPSPSHGCFFLICPHSAQMSPSQRGPSLFFLCKTAPLSLSVITTFFHSFITI